MDIHSLIVSAKLGRARKDAQIDTCTVFAAALYDLLSKQGIACRMIEALKKGLAKGYDWGHSVVEVDGKYYDSMGEFSTEIYRSRAKIHPAATVEIEYRPDSRLDCYDPEDFEEMYAFYAKVLSKSLAEQMPHIQTKPSRRP